MSLSGLGVEWDPRGRGPVESPPAPTLSGSSSLRRPQAARPELHLHSVHSTAASTPCLAFRLDRSSLESHNGRGFYWEKQWRAGSRETRPSDRGGLVRGGSRPVQPSTGPRKPRRGRHQPGSGGAACCIGSLGPSRALSWQRGASLKTPCRQPPACHAILAHWQADPVTGQCGCCPHRPVSREHKGQEPPQIVACRHPPNPDPVYPELAAVPLGCTSQVGPSRHPVLPHATGCPEGDSAANKGGPWRKGSEVRIILGVRVVTPGRAGVRQPVSVGASPPSAAPVPGQQQG